MKIPRKRIITLAAALLFIFVLLPMGAETPVLMYHHVSETAAEQGLNVDPQAFSRQMEFLKVHGYRVVPLGELLNGIKAGKHFPARTVAITFDDGNVDNFENAFPILKKMNFPAAIFMITDDIGKSGRLSEEDLKILDSSGIEIGSHTAHHAFLPNCGLEEARAELRDSKSRLETLLGHPVTLFSYPAGGVTQSVRGLVEQEGYAGAVTTNYGRKRRDPYALHRIKITASDANLFRFWAKTSGFYLWGKRRVEIV
ncbi:MAG: polysaccharide deacetylase family protein [Candidatus Omnitrophica bacterium]|nr:polysaccharide deacetylase family protein [Candidatus Omnitrophota bacterium]